MMNDLKARLTQPNGGHAGPVHVRDPRAGIEPVTVMVTPAASGVTVKPAGKDADKGGDCPTCKRPY